MDTREQRGLTRPKGVAPLMDAAKITRYLSLLVIPLLPLPVWTTVIDPMLDLHLLSAQSLLLLESQYTII
jgi:hypothetical protein